MEHHKQDTDTQVFFYEREFYVLSNFSAFQIEWEGRIFQTAEHLYHWLKFERNEPLPVDIRATVTKLRKNIYFARSAHSAFKIAEENAAFYRPDWIDVRVDLMREILRAKVGQHEYVRRKLIETGDRELVEDSWRDGWWGWGADKKGQNMLGKLWMEIREDLQSSILQSKQQEDVWAVTE